MVGTPTRLLFYNIDSKSKPISEQQKAGQELDAGADRFFLKGRKERKGGTQQADMGLAKFKALFTKNKKEKAAKTDAPETDGETMEINIDVE